MIESLESVSHAVRGEFERCLSCSPSCLNHLAYRVKINESFATLVDRPSLVLVIVLLQFLKILLQPDSIHILRE